MKEKFACRKQWFGCVAKCIKPVTSYPYYYHNECIVDYINLKALILVALKPLMFLCDGLNVGE